MKFSCSVLTCDVLNRLEALLDMDSVTEADAKEIEHCAYCACMGSNDKDSSFVWLLHLLMLYFDFEVISDKTGYSSQSHRFRLHKKENSGTARSK